ncbi:MAG: DNA polymerase III subunit chi [Candidatus Tokpelaia sp. JSC085]|nr:MAG: DNA polymerase III subunit chi [Candidatus Tokpelaia sp. JSC085]
MRDAFFYHLTLLRLEDILPRLIERSLQRGWHVTVQFTTEKRRDAVDSLLWIWKSSSFIGHGTEQNKWPEEQPVFLTTGDANPNASQVRFCVEGARCAEPDSYERVVIMFDEQEVDQLARARQEWKSLKGRGYNLTYWQKTLNRKWKQKKISHTYEHENGYCP